MPMSSHFVADQPQIHLGACSIAGGSNRYAVNQMGQKLLPSGGIIEANVVWGLAGSHFRGSLVKTHEDGFSYQRALTWSFPVAGESLFWAQWASQFKVVAPAFYKLSTVGEDASPWPEDGKYKYRYVVP